MIIIFNKFEGIYLESQVLFQPKTSIKYDLPIVY